MIFKYFKNNKKKTADDDKEYCKIGTKIKQEMKMALQCIQKLKLKVVRRVQNQLLQTSTLYEY